ncbi:MAG: ABC transporter permease subunit [Pontiellaceae bacterium]|nr:ABC transporter permease subunit [Pontiellaceae bacterium]
MIKFILKRLFELIPVLFVAITMVFFMVRLAPGGPFTQEKSFSPEAIARLNEHYGLDKPILVQYGNYMLNLLKGDLGPSFQYPSRSVNEIIRETFPVSLELGAWALLFALTIGLVAGIVASLRPNTLQDHIPMGMAMTGICMPSFVLGPILILIFGLWLGWFNASGWDTASDRILPAITLGSAYAAYISRLTRGSMLEVLPSDYIRTARAKGLKESTVILKHALKNALLPVVSFLGPATAGIITGSFVVETIFNIPGMGRMFVSSAFNRDYTLILGLVVFLAFLVVVFNVIADILLGLLNPKMRMDS